MAITLFPPNIVMATIGDSGNGSSRASWTLNTAGTLQALMLSFASPYDTTLEDFLFFQSGFAGTQANIEYTVRLCTLTSISTISTVVATTTVTPNVGTNKWVKATFSSPPSISQNVTYGIVVTNSSTNPATDYGIVQYNGGSNASNGTFYSFYTSANGFTGNGSWRESRGPFVVCFGNGVNIGNPYTTSAATTSGTYERGIMIPSQDGTFDIAGFSTSPNVPASAGSAVKLYRGTTLPGGTVIVSATDNGSVSWLQGTILAGSQHRLVMDYSSNSDRPSTLEIEDYSSYSELATVRPFGGAHYTYEDAGAWVDVPEKWPCMAIWIGSLPAASGGGGVRRADLSGGFNG